MHDYIAKNFLKDIKDLKQARGKKLFLNNSYNNFNHTDNTYSIEVFDSTGHNTSNIVFNNDEIENINCTCGANSKENPCQHAYTLLYYIANADNNIKKIFNFDLSDYQDEDAIFIDETNKYDDQYTLETITDAIKLQSKESINEFLMNEINDNEFLKYSILSKLVHISAEEETYIYKSKINKLISVLTSSSSNIDQLNRNQEKVIFFTHVIFATAKERFAQGNTLNGIMLSLLIINIINYLYSKNLVAVGPTYYSALSLEREIVLLLNNNLINHVLNKPEHIKRTIYELIVNSISNIKNDIINEKGYLFYFAHMLCPQDEYKNIRSFINKTKNTIQSYTPLKKFLKIALKINDNSNEGMKDLVLSILKTQNTFFKYIVSEYFFTTKNIDNFNLIADSILQEKKIDPEFSIKYAQDFAEKYSTLNDNNRFAEHGINYISLHGTKKYSWIIKNLKEKNLYNDDNKNRIFKALTTSPYISISYELMQINGQYDLLEKYFEFMTKRDAISLAIQFMDSYGLVLYENGTNIKLLNILLSKKLSKKQRKQVENIKTLIES